jgi:hypothetical protein
MPTFCRWLSGRCSLRSPRLSEEGFGCGINEGHLARCRIGAGLIINEAIWVMLARELSTRGANLIGARAERHSKYLVRCTTSCHREAS